MKLLFTALLFIYTLATNEDAWGFSISKIEYQFTNPSVTNVPVEGYQEVQDRPFIHRGNNQALWMKVSMENATKNENGVLELVYSDLSEVDFFLKGEAGFHRLHKTGFNFPFIPPLIQYKNPSIPISIPLHETKDVWIRTLTQGNFVVPLELRSQQDFDSYRFNHNILISIFIGFGLALIIYNGSIYLVSRNNDFLFCGLFTYGSIHLFNNTEGLYRQYFWMTQQHFHNVGLYIAIISITIGLIGITVNYSKNIAEQDLRFMHLTAWTLYAIGCAASLMQVSSVENFAFIKIYGRYIYLFMSVITSTLLSMVMAAKFERFSRQRASILSVLSLHQEEELLLKAASDNLHLLPKEHLTNIELSRIHNESEDSLLCNIYLEDSNELQIIWMTFEADPLVSILLKGGIAGSFRCDALKEIANRGLDYTLEETDRLIEDMIGRDSNIDYKISGLTLDFSTGLITGAFASGCIVINDSYQKEPLLNGESFFLKDKNCIKIHIADGLILSFSYSGRTNLEVVS